MAKTRGRTEFGQRLLDARKAAQLTQPQVAKALGMSQGTLSELETTANSSGRVAELAALYGVSAHYLATGEGPMHLEDTASLRLDAVDIAGADDDPLLEALAWLTEAERQDLIEKAEERRRIAERNLRHSDPKPSRKRAAGGSQ